MNNSLDLFDFIDKSKKNSYNKISPTSLSDKSILTDDARRANNFYP